ncbi:uncharacterized protein Z518_01471 [Rhinocladiella mackenziei CBS 650.93]|uniref:Uncharacterized protein n=1 Tax=Rhinocladiella mackenziei CBS 650.93 TaxID=1442369 RepID=A0A0D2IWL3_9EURO|nr:uncharacterized protein Z518_01471 [Rhinocladiella mackenziei CBS 650.93]KIX10389.1 hypothetical protein Z518_01471 [Rhinocladiella mackenziei CBS 650.93]
MSPAKKVAIKAAATREGQKGQAGLYHIRKFYTNRESSDNEVKSSQMLEFAVARGDGSPETFLMNHLRFPKRNFKLLTGSTSTLRCIVLAFYNQLSEEIQVLLDDLDITASKVLLLHQLGHEDICSWIETSMALYPGV